GASKMRQREPAKHHSPSFLWVCRGIHRPARTQMLASQPMETVPMCGTRVARLLAGCALLGLAGCGSSTPQLSMQGEEIPMPPAYGLYAYNGDNLTRLDGSADWERSTWGDRSDLPPKVEFLVYEPTVATDPTSLPNLIQLRRVAHVRNQINASGQVAPAQNNRWGAPDLPDYRVGLNYTPAPGHPDILVAKPSDELGEGLYSF